jgi:hypothetical protein
MLTVETIEGRVQTYMTEHDAAQSCPKSELLEVALPCSRQLTFSSLIACDSRATHSHFTVSA